MLRSPGNSIVSARLILHAPPSKLQFRFFLIDLPNADAFAVPGGRIYVSRKLISFVRSEDELAGVLSHEMGHILARQQSARISAQLRSLGVNSVGDRNDIRDKYDRLLQQPQRPKQTGSEEGQIEADRLGVYLAYAAGYNPEAVAEFFDRLTDNHGATGGLVRDFFNLTRPESKRLRQMIKLNRRLSSSCIDETAKISPDEFRKWQAAVTEAPVRSSVENVAGLRSRVSLDPPLQPDLLNARFSPDGKYLVAQDSGTIYVLTREPFALLFRIDTPNARLTRFSPDSKQVVFLGEPLRVERWDVAQQKRLGVREVVVNDPCRMNVSPDGSLLACIDAEKGLRIYDLSAQEPIFRKMLLPSAARVPHFETQLGPGGPTVRGIAADGRVAFSADGRYLLSTLAVGTDHKIVLYDCKEQREVPVPNALKKAIVGPFVTIGKDQVIAVHGDREASPIITLPGGESPGEVRLPAGSVAAAFESSSQGRYLLARPFGTHAVGVIDIAKQEIVKAGTTPAIDLYGDQFVAERSAGELGLYSNDKNILQATVKLGGRRLSESLSAAFSPDLKWLSASVRSRGMIWESHAGQFVFQLTGFDGGWFSPDGQLFALFPKSEKRDRHFLILEPKTKGGTSGPDILAPFLTPAGPVAITFKPAAGGALKRVLGSTFLDSVMEARDAKEGTVIWSRPFPELSPLVWPAASGQNVILLGWPARTKSAADLLKSEETSGVHLNVDDISKYWVIQSVEARTGKNLGVVAVDLGTQQNVLVNARLGGEWLAVTDAQQRVLVISVKTGERLGQVFGRVLDLDPATQQLLMERQPGEVHSHHLPDLKESAQWTFPSRVVIGAIGRGVEETAFLTSDQSVYFVETPH